MGKAIERYFLTEEKDNTAAIFIISGFNFSGSGQNAGMAFVALKTGTSGAAPKQRRGDFGAGDAGVVPTARCAGLYPDAAGGGRVGAVQRLYL